MCHSVFTSAAVGESQLAGLCRTDYFLVECCFWCAYILPKNR
uniref:Uncharacterized protein n=1 Tax=Siphoviridae sp. ctXQ014 TaxID=2825542 RepID=A0A8S5PP45_9CAUD|nr:MAG TPA: hypothetical protein [Siphoviridae sp. ctXQ014]